MTRTVSRVTVHAALILLLLLVAAGPAFADTTPTDPTGAGTTITRTALATVGADGITTTTGWVTDEQATATDAEAERPAAAGPPPKWLVYAAIGFAVVVAVGFGYGLRNHTLPPLDPSARDEDPTETNRPAPTGEPAGRDESETEPGEPAGQNGGAFSSGS